jgi:molybdopterin molybdotransferase
VIPLAEAQSFVLSHCQPKPSEELPLHESLGCVTSVGIFADAPVPPFDNSAMDGFAVRAVDTSDAPTRLKVIGELPAGRAPTMEVCEGEAVRIMTGAPIPAGADAIVVIEDAEVESNGDVVRVVKPVDRGLHVRPAGQDLSPGQLVFPAGTELGPGHLGVLASLGMTEVPVYPRPRIGVLSTGDELIDGPGDLEPGKIRDSNRHTLLALARQSGRDVVDLGLVRDDEKAISAAVERGVAECDVLVTSGGVSMGDLDHVKTVLDRLGGQSMRWMQVAIKPAHPLAFGVVSGKPVFGLPGNPVSAMVSFELFVSPAIRQIMGHEFPMRARVAAVTDEALPRQKDGKVHFFRVEATYMSDGRFHVRPTGGQASNLLRTMALANALAIVDDGPGVKAGDPVDVLLLDYR